MAKKKEEPKVDPEAFIEKLDNMPFDTGRAIYLAATTKTAIPNKFMKYIQNADVLNEIASSGIGGAKLVFGLPDADKTLEKLFTQGKKLSPDQGTVVEYKLHISDRINSRITADTSLTQLDRLTLHGRLYDWFNQSKVDELVGKTEGDVDTGEIEEIDKWKTGLNFLDALMGDGWYQGLHIIIAEPGSGKTSTMLALMETLRANNMASSIWYFSLETPRGMVRARMAPMVKRTKFLPGKDKIFAGMWTPDEIIERISEDPDPNRVILYDGPDVLAEGEGKRFILDSAYRKLVMIKQASKAVFVPSQPKNNGEQMSMNSVAESWTKAWFADTVTGIEFRGVINEIQSLRASNFKNRFGPKGKRITYTADYGEFIFELTDDQAQPDNTNDGW